LFQKQEKFEPITTTTKRKHIGVVFVTFPSILLCFVKQFSQKNML